MLRDTRRRSPKALFMTVWRPSIRSAERVTAFVRAEVRQALARNGQSVSVRRQRAVRTRALELREAELDGIEVRAIGWHVPEGGPGGLEGPLDAGDLVGPRLVGNDDVAWLQSRHQDLFDVSAEALAIDCAVEDPGAVSPVTRNAARNVLVCRRPQGAWSWTRAPRGARPYRRSRLLVLPVSSSNTRWATSQVGAAACHATRAAATSGRSCSDGRTVFFNGQAKGPYGAPDRRHTRGRGEGVLQLSQRAIRVRRQQRGQGV